MIKLNDIKEYIIETRACKFDVKILKLDTFRNGTYSNGTYSNGKWNTNVIYIAVEKQPNEGDGFPL